MLRSCSLREQPEYKNHANHERPFNPDDDILVENVWFILIVYTPPPLFIFFSLVYISLTQL